MPVKYKNKKWVVGATRNASFLNNLMLAGYVKTPLFKAPEFPSCIFITKDGTKTNYIFEEEGWNKFGEGLVRLCSNPKRVESLEKKYRKFAINFLNSVNKFNSDITAKNFDVFLENYKLFGAGLVITLMMGRSVFDALKNRLEKLEIKNIDEVIGYITYPDIHTPLSVSRIELLKIAKKRCDDKWLDKELDAWLDKFGHIPVNFAEEPWLIEDAREQLRQIDNNPDQALELMMLNHKSKLKEKRKILRNINDKPVRDFANALATTTILNEFRKNIFCKVSLEYRKAYQKISEKAGGTHWRDCFYLTPVEMKNIILGKKINILQKKEKTLLGVFLIKMVKVNF